MFDFFTKRINLQFSFFISFNVTGTSFEKIRSIFNLYEIDENNVFDDEDLNDYISNSFKVLLKEMNID